MFFNESDQVRITVMCDNKDTLSGVFLLVRVSQDVPQTTTFDCNDHALERNTSLRLERSILLWPPTERFHVAMLTMCVPFVTKTGSYWKLPQVKSSCDLPHACTIF